MNILVGSAITAQVDAQNSELADLDTVLSEQLDAAQDDAVSSELHADDAALPADPADAVSEVAGFEEVFIYTDGLEVSVSTPEAYTPGDYAYQSDEGGEPIVFDVTVTNGTNENLDGSYILTNVISDGREAVKIYDDGSTAVGRAPSCPASRTRSRTRSRSRTRTTSRSRSARTTRTTPRSSSADVVPHRMPPSRQGGRHPSSRKEVPIRTHPIGPRHRTVDVAPRFGTPQNGGKRP